MAYEDDPMLAEIRQIRKALWEESDHDFHTMIRIIKQEAKEIISEYGKAPAKSSEQNVFVLTNDTRPT